MKDIQIEEGINFPYPLSNGKTLAVVVITGSGYLFDDQTGTKHYANEKDFVLIHSHQQASLGIQAGTHSPLRVAMIEVPSKTSYPLYRSQ